VGKKTALLQAEAGAFVLGLENVLFFARGVLFPQCDHQAQSAWGEKIKTPCSTARTRRIHFCHFILSLSSLY